MNTTFQKLAMPRPLPIIDRQTAFWKAFNVILDGNYIFAEVFLRNDISGDPSQSNYVWHMREDAHHWSAAFTNPKRQTALDKLTAAGLHNAIQAAVRSGKIHPIESVNALIENSVFPTPSSAYQISASEKIALLQLYELEACLLQLSPHCTTPLVEWLETRKQKAFWYFNQ